ncbi:MAG TPA: nuclear transport factor 2 family protein [Chthoniobacterales bacterium]|nr:nuclear transport factor 2 family protein [Chthoniobacterales bacterium]
MHTSALALVTCACIGAALSGCRRPIPPAPDRDAIAATVQGFHDALAKGDRAAAMSFLADDAQILESGHRETREQYEAGHLASDIEFARAVPSTKGPFIVRQEGNVAWTMSTSRSSGRFQSRDIDAEGAELVVLTKEGERWKIRAIHWSSHSHRGGH